MARVNYIKCDICGKVIDENTFDSAIRFFAGIIHKGKIDICKSCLGKIDKVYEDIRTEEELVRYAIDSENAEEFKEDTNLYTAYLTGVQDTAKYLSQHQIVKGKI